MANCKKGAAAAPNSVVRRANAARIIAVNGVVAKLEIRNDIAPTWQSAKQDAYYGLVPIINGTEFYDLSFLPFDLLSENVPHYPNGDTVEFFTPDDDLHRAAREAWKPDVTVKEWLEAILQAVGNEVELVAHPYAAHNKNGGTFQAAQLGGKKR